MAQELTMSCRGCDRRWESIAQAHCSACHRHFSTTGNFDAHRDRGRCKAPSRIGMKTVDRAGGKVWVRKGQELEDAA